MLKYRANIFGMTGVARIATAFFNRAGLFEGLCVGVYLVILGALFQSFANGEN